MRGFNFGCSFKRFTAKNRDNSAPKKRLITLQNSHGRTANIRHERRVPKSPPPSSRIKEVWGREGYRSVIRSHLYHQLIRWQIIPGEDNEHKHTNWTCIVCARGSFPPAGDVMTDGARAWEEMERWEAAKWDMIRCTVVLCRMMSRFIQKLWRNSHFASHLWLSAEFSGLRRQQHITDGKEWKSLEGQKRQMIFNNPHRYVWSWQGGIGATSKSLQPTLKIGSTASV